MISAVGSDRAQRALAAISAALAIASAGARALAEPTAADKAAAEVLFNDAQRLVKEGKYAEACPKYAESLRLDVGIGTMLYLADCYEKNGQTASAWGQFREAASMAKNAGQSDREKKAIDRAAALEPKLLRLSVSVAPEAASIPGLEVKRDGEVVGKALWGTAVPGDPGDHLIEASAPGKKKWSTTVKLAEGATAPVTVQVPALEVDPEANKPKVEPPKVEPPKVEPPKPESTNLGPIFGYTAAGLGVGGLVTGGILGVIAINKNSASNSLGTKPDLSGALCRPNNVCNTEGERLRRSALNFATGSTVAMIAGGALLAGGVLTIIITRGGSSSAKKTGLLVSPTAGPGAGGVLVQGGF